MFGGIKLAVAVVMTGAILGAAAYLQTLRHDLRTLQENNAQLVQATQQQQAVIAQQKLDWERIKQANQQLQTQKEQLSAEITALDNRFHAMNASGQKRDIGALAVQRPTAVARIINTATQNANRCMAIAMGALLTEQEKNATKPSEINPECPALANPLYNTVYQ